VSFETYEMNIDLSKFNQVDLEEENHKNTFRMKKIDQLKISIDTLQQNYGKDQEVFSENFGKKSAVTQIVKKEKKYECSRQYPYRYFWFYRD